MTGVELSSRLPDYQSDEFCAHRGLLGAAPSVADILSPLIRFLLRVQSVATRVALRAPAFNIRPIAEIVLCNNNPCYLYYLQLKACETLQFVREMLDTIHDICISVAEGGDTTAARNRVPMVWQTVQARFAHWHNSSLPWLTDMTDFDDLLARYSLAASGTSPAASALIGDQMRTFYSRKASVDIAGPEKPIERPLKDVILDLWHHVGFRTQDKTIVDYGAGFGRTRHYFYRIAEKAGGDVAAVAASVRYCMIDVQAVAPHMQGRSTFPNGPHHDSARQRGCPCSRCGGNDMLLLIDPSLPNSVTSARSLSDHNMWHSKSTDRQLPRTHRLVLVNVLHEVPMTVLPVLMANLLHIVPVGGVVFLYELQQIPSVEDDYVVWYPEDIRSLFGEIGFAVACVVGRTHNQTQRLGYRYTGASMLRTQKQTLSMATLDRLVRELYVRRLETLRRRIEVTGAKLRGRLASDATRVEHFHAVHSLVNAYRQVNS